ncbi:class I SAM-dependent methyltransferase [Paenibacillus polymyxa]|uniref:class I SAM-dependent methyltransferase n=1 Tax=Paenibacillus TaxID=44249 RepID=UPI000F4D4066|nr:MULTISPECIES: class I SAM-dependent methyltransferase [Paenibacillus]KAF6659339.1 class I SAM-dependent methyltransferase [Paenibacillus sp. EKM301P]MBE3646554.1 class I SAM-dependent methyltransferase [Paenibacillus polymyxa]RPE01840.1 class I SAM-dependent methyltransferase [Paenibacillus polymyxa]UBS85881.1 class I SAM-dependent methyltransferase [Paenibacillus polymyxa]WHX34405.1 class I SAM-dependent methyltransferase [Paenibacillus polymyxa]
MSEYYWDIKIDYLRNTRWLYYNDDYLEFLIQKMWKINKPVEIVDYGCGFGYLGLKLLPLLPNGSTYTGIDKGMELIKQANEIFSKLSYNAEFIECDIEKVELEKKYDIAVSHAFLLHMPNPKSVLQKMLDSVQDNGMVICFEPHWIGNMADYYLDGIEPSDVIRLGILQELYERDHKRTAKDGNIGIQIPIMLSQLGLRNVGCRVSDKVNFLDQNMDTESKNMLYSSLKEEGLGQEPNDISEVLKNLLARGLNEMEAQKQYEAEATFSEEFSDKSWLVYAPNMKISFGTVK